MKNLRRACARFPFRCAIVKTGLWPRSTLALMPCELTEANAPPLPSGIAGMRSDDFRDSVIAITYGFCKEIEGMSTSSTYRADHVGSFLRPADLLQARKCGIPSDELRALEDRHVKRVLEKQQELGLGISTDGEFRRSNFMSDFTDAVEGFDLGDGVIRRWDEDKRRGAQTATAVSSITGIVASKLKQRWPLAGRELPFLQQYA